MIKIYPLNEKAITIEFGSSIDESVLSRINRLDLLLRKKPFPGMYTTVPAYTTLTVFFEPLKVISAAGLTGKNCFEKVAGYVRHLNNEYSNEPSVEAHSIITIPVCYGGVHGPDLIDVGGFHGMRPEKVVEIHSSVIYTVYMVGFIPGFAYLGGMPPLLETPRKSLPRKVIHAGAVGIGGKQTGIYPLETPGGWQIIGQTPLRLFDINNNPPALLKAGDRIRFKPITISEFKLYRNKQHAANH